MKSLLVALAVCALGCPQEPRERPDVACADVCKKRIVGCTEAECDRGCAFVLDRLVEHEQETVLACVERKTACADEAWADCASKVGPHADGGPPVPEHVAPEE